MPDKPKKLPSEPPKRDTKPLLIKCQCGGGDMQVVDKDSLYCPACGITVRDNEDTEPVTRVLITGDMLKPKDPKE